MKKQRLFYLDLIRAVALVCILVIHFNAAVTGYFTLPSKLFGSVLPFNIYLGDFGSSLFFMVSGAALQYTSPGQGREPLNLARFYQKRAKAVYPMFWLAWCIFFPIRFVTKPGYYAAAKTPSLLLTVLGLDNFAQAAGWVTMDFACVGEWFLGSILFLYLLFPLLRWGLRKQPLLTWAVVLTAQPAGALHGVGCPPGSNPYPGIPARHGVCTLEAPGAPWRAGRVCGAAVYPCCGGWQGGLCAVQCRGVHSAGRTGGLHPLGAAAKCVCAPQQVFLCGLSDPPCHHSAPGG